MSSPIQDLPGLLSLLTTTSSLLTNFLNALSPSNPAQNSSTTTTAASSQQYNPLDILHDAAKLLKAHTTKLSLLTLNKPFTPSAIASLVKEISQTCLPAMMSAVELCQPSIWGSTMCEEVRARVRRVLRECGVLLQEVRGVAEVENGATGHKKQNRDTLASTGVVWDACDALIELKSLGVAGLVVKKGEQYRETLRDAIEELKEWAEEEEDEGYTSNEDADDADELEDMFKAGNKHSSGSKELKELLAEVLKKLKLVQTLYQALGKRRLKVLPAVQQNQPSSADDSSASQVITRLDSLMKTLKQIPDSVDDLASAFYDLDKDQATKLYSKILKHACTAATSMQNDWNGAEDAFTQWSTKWLEAVQAPPPET